MISRRAGCVAADFEALLASVGQRRNPLNKRWKIRAAVGAGRPYLNRSLFPEIEIVLQCGELEQQSDRRQYARPADGVGTGDDHHPLALQQSRGYWSVSEPRSVSFMATRTIEKKAAAPDREGATIRLSKLSD